MNKILLIFLIVIISCCNLFAEWISVEWMNDAQRIDSVYVIQLQQHIWVELQNIADLLGADWRCDSSGNHIRLDMPIEALIFTVNTPFVLAGDRTKQIPLPILKHDERFFIPIEDLIALLSEFYPGELLYDPASPALLLTPPRHDLFGFKYNTESGFTNILIPAMKLLECNDSKEADGSVKLVFKKSKIDTNAFKDQAIPDVISELSALQKDNDAEIVIKAKQGTEFDGVEIIIDPPLYCVRFRTQSAGGLRIDEQRRLEAEKSAWAFDVVVIDPGHGGKDPGAIGPTRLYEKDVVLDVGLRLRKALEKHGIKTVMTRETDKFIPLDERGRIANRSGGKLFVSLHCNALAHGKKAYGIETYFLAPAKTDRAMRVALKENSVISYEESQDQYQDLTEENFILLTMAQANFVRESEYLASIVQEKVSRGVSLPDRGVDQAGFYVLYGASMPAILVEMAFISTRTEENKLRDKKFRQAIADYLCKAILNFSAQSE
ncbi:N-acetylmuramoyl-L-alanine amidase [bacterium]|nr:N-acetylmuramoyl-L-alanine amidase [bacterium]